MSKLVPSTPITLDRERRLVCDFNAAALVKEFCGRNFFAGQNVLIERNDDGSNRTVKAKDAQGTEREVPVIDPVALRAILAAFLSDEDPSMTPVKAGRLITMQNFGEVTLKCIEQMNLYFNGGIEPEPTENPTPAPAEAQG
jgi:hypothetical protein